MDGSLLSPSAPFAIATHVDFGDKHPGYALCSRRDSWVVPGLDRSSRAVALFVPKLNAIFLEAEDFITVFIRRPPMERPPVVGLVPAPLADDFLVIQFRRCINGCPHCQEQRSAAIPVRSSFFIATAYRFHNNVSLFRPRDLRRISRMHCIF